MGAIGSRTAASASGQPYRSQAADALAAAQTENASRMATTGISARPNRVGIALSNTGRLPSRLIGPRANTTRPPTTTRWPRDSRKKTSATAVSARTATRRRHSQTTITPVAMSSGAPKNVFSSGGAP